MSQDTKTDILHVKHDAEAIKTIADGMKRVAPKDAELIRKIEKISESAGEVVKHIQERTEK